MILAVDLHRSGLALRHVLESGEGCIPTDTAHIIAVVIIGWLLKLKALGTWRRLLVKDERLAYRVLRLTVLGAMFRVPVCRAWTLLFVSLLSWLGIVCDASLGHHWRGLPRNLLNAFADNFHYSFLKNLVIQQHGLACARSGAQLATTEDGWRGCRDPFELWDWRLF
jgi:hypothetical protein